MFLEVWIIQLKEDGNVSVAWFDNHLAGLKGKSAQLSENAKSRWKNPNPMQKHTKSKAERKRDRKKDIFIPPTPIELEKYFFERIQIRDLAHKESNKFFNFYESKGWMVGKNKMKDWKASCRNWLKNIVIPSSQKKSWTHGN